MSLDGYGSWATILSNGSRVSSGQSEAAEGRCGWGGGEREGEWAGWYSLPNQRKRIPVNIISGLCPEPVKVEKLEPRPKWSPRDTAVSAHQRPRPSPTPIPSNPQPPTPQTHTLPGA